ncbi:TPA: hypothetical protein DIC20_05745 [Candidatus Dependentiae bacterium]|nr:MAG: hypothetical protein US03_C0010G0072 [candidate division TM6 bacterium GW2011_GWF2_36_131]KKQ02743.1 MAG: hypothetical protein US13_C0010G0003 [candidate division TM6 bacterium GW2011_GWE2_36_25]KKQ19160.1 MAG: hypothetical protein US32_C0015G0043 [candidate division TM6 bacterium GW2011_GWA2_36_9]HBR70396.1 hypothetical protein [Candidatus Dependentiae bacterium]HCU01168.1 hypothetical protein [Candidatus Dependentiae bacterium]
MSNVLFDECVKILKAKILPKFESEKMYDLFIQLYPMTKWGKIDWGKIDKKIEVGFDPENIIISLKNLLGNSFDKSVYIEWDDAQLAVIQTNLDIIIKHFDDVTCVAFEKFIFNPDIAYIIEILPSDKITVGVIPQVHA